MKLLAIDTALGACSVAIVDGDVVLAHRWVEMARGHAEALAPMVEDAMRDAALSFSQLERLAVTTGPGTFTGQRVGLAFARGLRVALKVPLIGVTTLEAMALAAMDEARAPQACAIHDARRGEVYFALRDATGLKAPPAVAKFDDACAQIYAQAQSVPLAFAGTAGEAAAENFRGNSGTAILTNIRQPDALWVARLGVSAPHSAFVPQPLYLRPPDAKIAQPKNAKPKPAKPKPARQGAPK